jgi:hypothetical protein
MFGDVVSVTRWFLFGIRPNHGRIHHLTFPPIVEESRPFSSIVDFSLDDPTTSLFTFQGLNPLHWTTTGDAQLCASFLPRRVLVATPHQSPAMHFAVFDPAFPAPFVPFNVTDFSSWSVNFGIPFVE